MDVLIYVEDPGAANYVQQLPCALESHKLTVKLFAGGSAKNYLHDRNIDFIPLSNYEDSKEVLECIRPKLLIVGTSEDPNTAGLLLVKRARYLGITSIGVVDAFPNAEYRFRGRSNDPLAYATDWLIVPDNFTKEAFIKMGYPSERIIVCGHPHYDYLKIRLSELQEQSYSELRKKYFPDADPKTPVVVFVAEVSTGLNPEQYLWSKDYTLQGWGSKNRTSVVLEEFLDAIEFLNPQPYLVLRLHPKNKSNEFIPYLNKFTLISSGGDPLELIYAADIIVGMTSSLLLEAAILQKPTLSIVPREAEKNWLPTIKEGITPCVIKRSELSQKLSQMMNKKDNKKVQGYTQLISGNSTEQIALSVSQILISEYCGGKDKIFPVKTAR